MMSEASCTSSSSMTAVVPAPLRSMSSSQNIADGRPELTVSKLPRSKSMRKRKSKTVMPATAVAAVDRAGEDDEGLLILNGTTPFDLRSLFQRARSTPTMLLQRQSTSGKAWTGDTPRRHLRGHEELCLVMPRQSDKGTASRKAWFMSAGTIGRESGESVVVATKDPSMDAVHAEITVHGDDYLLKDLNSSSGTYLCLSTTNRHHPQRDGYRLRAGDTVLLGYGARLEFTELLTIAKPVVDTGIAKKQSLQAKLDRRLTDQMALERSASHMLRRQNSKVMVRMPSFSDGRVKKSVRFSEAMDAGKMDPEIEPTLPADGGTEFPIGSRYRRKTKRPLQPVYPDLAPGGLTVVVTTPEVPDDATTIKLTPKTCYTIGSSPWCDVQVFSDGIFAVHARIVFDGHFYVLQDLSFEENPRRKTRVLLSRATRIGRGDWLLLGKCALSVANVYRAFRDHEPDLKEVAFKCHLLRPSKRKSRRREKYLPVAFKHTQAEAFVVGKGNMCDGQVFTATLSVEQFVLQVERGQCSLTPRFAGVNQGMYFLLGRDSLPHDATFKDDVIRYTSKALMLVEGSVFKIGSSELEVVFVKLEDTGEVAARAEEIKENTKILKEMPWLQQISYDRHSMENVARRAQRLMLEPGDNVYDEGDPASFLFVVMSGEVELISSHQTSARRGAGITRQGSGGNVVAAGAGEKEALVEVVCPGSYFGEVSLWAPEMDYAETAKALTECQLLVLSREDVCGYFAYYMDIIRPHLCYEAHKDLLQKLRLCVPFCSTLSYQELRVMASKAERLYFQQDDMILSDGVFTYKGKRRYGLLLLRYGAVDAVGEEDIDSTSSEALAEQAVDAELGIKDEAAPLPRTKSWRLDSPLLVLPHTPPDHLNLRARTGVQCFYIDISAFKHLIKEHESRAGTGQNATFKKTLSGSIVPPPVMRRRSTNRRSSYATQFKARHSQVFTTALRDNNGGDENDNLLENADLEDANDPSRKWRRKKRNRNLLEKTIVETQQNGDLLNALVLYVLSGANRGDIHVVRNVATIGGLISCADIELNDRYVSQQQAVIEHREGRYWLYDTFSEWGTYVRLEENQTVQIYPGDVFLAGEVEFTCMGAFPERKKSSMCCIQ